MTSWEDLLKLLTLAATLTHHLSSSEHEHPRPEVRCRIIGDGFCTPHDKADLCSDNQRITGRPIDDHHLIRIETIIKATGNRPDQAGNVTIDIKCKLRDGVKCFPHFRNKDDPEVPSDEEKARLTEGTLKKWDPKFAMVFQEFLEMKQKAFENDVELKVTEFLAEESRESVEKEVWRVLTPEQQAVYDNQTDEEKKKELGSKFETDNYKALVKYYQDLGDKKYKELAAHWRNVEFKKSDTYKNYLVALSSAIITTANRLRDEMCNSGVCDKTTELCAKMVCGKDMVCEDEPMNTEFTLTVSDTRRKTRPSSEGTRGTGSILLLMLAIIGPLLMLE